MMPTAHALAHSVQDFLTGVCDIPSCLMDLCAKIEQLSCELDLLGHSQLASPLKKFLCQHVNNAILLYAPNHQDHVNQWIDQIHSFATDHNWSAELKGGWTQHVGWLILHAQAHMSQQCEQERLVWHTNSKTSELLAHEFELWLASQIIEQIAA
jgi:hypothetical protein